MNDYTWARLVLVGFFTIGIIVVSPILLIIELVRTVVGADKENKKKRGKK